MEFREDEAQIAVSAQIARIGSWLSLLVTMIVLWALTFLAVMHQSETFKLVVDFGAELPKVTALILNVPPVGYFACSSMLSLMLVTKEIAWPNHFGALLMNLIALGTIIICFLVHREFLLMPVRSLMQDLS